MTPPCLLRVSSVQWERDYYRTAHPLKFRSEHGGQRRWNSAFPQMPLLFCISVHIFRRNCTCDVHWKKYYCPILPLIYIYTTNHQNYKYIRISPLRHFLLRSFSLKIALKFKINKISVLRNFTWNKKQKINYIIFNLLSVYVYLHSPEQLQQNTLQDPVAQHSHGCTFIKLQIM